MDTPMKSGDNLVKKRATKIGLFSSDPWSRRVKSLEQAFNHLEVEVIHVLPWKVLRWGSTDFHRVVHEGVDLSELDMMLVLDLGANDIGAFFNRVGLLSALTELGVKVVNSVQSILLMRNKAETLRKLVSAGLPIPRSLITESIEDSAEFVRENFPCVLKPITGFGGHGVQLIDREFDRKNIYDYLKFHSQMFGKGAFILQEFVKSPGFDIRALVVKRRVIATMQRVGGEGITNNIHKGGIPRKNDIDVTDLSLKVAESVKGDIVGVDIIPDMEGNLWVLEANATPGWNGLQQVTDFDISTLIADLISQK
ncbi:RimK family alpha-L-glutamate ligase [Candidatus Thorarchaeota archaeon]|nr:MAG: RimK family alpha-L-glutamate ligase [Candidatus Thorarchaeota archaeon]